MSATPMDVDDLEALERDVEALRRNNRILTLRREKARIQRLNTVLQTSFGNSPSPEDSPPRASIDDDNDNDDDYDPNRQPQPRARVHKDHTEDDDYTWDEFKEVMELALGDPENRGRVIWDKYYNTRQGPNQTVATFESYLIGLIDELGDVGPKRARLERFRSSLRPEIKAIVVNNGVGHYTNEYRSKKPKNPNSELLGVKGKEKA
ncbi:hypothetical protein BGZ57DRAFT_862289 [Hyaloscypha finlandica]|nr:hypothetical protein BGZ57DRAFT_862289 [Hyaloscypha finlandica]